MKRFYYLNWVDEDNLAHSEILAPDNKKRLIGRAPTAEIVVSNPSVSRIHAQLSWEDNILILRDLNSSFGTWLNDKKIEVNQNKALYENGEIRLGSLSIWYEIHDKSNYHEAVQTSFFTEPQKSEPKLTSELSAFKAKLFQNIKAYGEQDLLSEQLEESLNKELHVLCAKHEEQLKEQRILNSISHILNRSHTLSELSKNALDLISKVFSAERGFVVLYSSTKKYLELVAKRNFEEPLDLSSITNNGKYSNTLVEKCYKHNQIIMIDDAQVEPLLSNLNSIESSGARSIVVIPLRRQDQVIGVIYLDNSNRSHCFKERHEPFLETFAAHTSIALHNAQLYKRAITDDLTGLYTRQYIDERLAQELERARRYRRPFSILMVDLDHFKYINDTYGHSAGDLVLQIVSNILKKQLRDTDVAGRLGGEEFIVILGETLVEGAKNFAERVREKIENQRIRKDGTIIDVTASIGVACYQARHSDQVQRLIDDADKALYRAKENGRNQVVVSE